MMRRARLRFWLAALDIAQALRAPLPVYLWLVGRASNAVDWGHGAVCGKEVPF